MEQSTVFVLEVAYGNGVLDDKSVKECEAVDTRKIPELLTTDIVGTDEVKSDADMEAGDNAGRAGKRVIKWTDVSVLLFIHVNIIKKSYNVVLCVLICT